MSGLQPDERGILTTCQACGKRNRLSYARLDKRSRCGHCSADLRPPADPVEVPSGVVFDALIRESSLPVVIDFWAPWCGPCRMVAPELAKAATATSGEYLIVKVNTEALPEIGDRFRIQSIPTMAVFRHGLEVTRTSGARPAADIVAFVRSAVAP